MTPDLEKIKETLAPLIPGGFLLMSADAVVPSAPGLFRRPDDIVLRSVWLTPKGEKYANCYCSPNAVNDAELWKSILNQVTEYIGRCP